MTRPHQARLRVALVLALAACVPQLTDVPCSRDENCPGVAQCLCGVCVAPDAGRPAGCPATGGGSAGGGSVGGGSAGGGSVGGGSVGGGSVGGGSVGGGSVGGGSAGGDAGGVAGGGTAGGDAGGVAGGAAGGDAGGAAGGDAGGSVGGGSSGGGSSGGGSSGGGSSGGGSSGGGSVVGGGAGGGCTRVTCTQVLAQCGMIMDGCGGTANCGTCPSPATCSTNNRCVTPEDQLRAVQAAVDGIIGGGPANVDLPVDGVIVTAVKPSVPGADPFADAPGFFVQSGAAAIFVETLAVAPTPNPGDRVSFRVTRVAREFGARRVKGVANYAFLGGSQPLPATVEVGSLDPTNPTVRLANESRLVTVAMRAVSANTFDGGNAGYGEVSFTSLPTTTTLRMPAQLDQTEDLRARCSVNAVGPLWFTTAPGGRVSVWTPNQLTGSSCSAPSFVDAGSPNPTTLLVSTSRYMSNSVTPSRFIVTERGGGTMPPGIGGVSLALPQLFVLNGAMQLGREYEVSAAAAGPVDTRGVQVPAGPPIPFVAGGCVSTSPLVISAVSVASGVDYVELHNRSRSPLSLVPYAVAFQLPSGSGGTVNLNGTLQPGQYLLLSSSGGDLTFPNSLDVAGGWVAIVPSGSGSACTPNTLDAMGWGTNQCMSNFLPAGFVGYRRNDTFGCIDANQPNDWSTTLATPRRALSAPQTCLCP